MELVKLVFIGKKNHGRGYFVYIPIVCIGKDYYKCCPLLKLKEIKKNQVNINDLVISSKIEPELYNTNRLVNLKD